MQDPERSYGETTPSMEAIDLTKRYPMFFRRRDRALALLGATKRLAYKTALDRVTLRAYPGEALGIIGENGSGKSTLLRLVAGISHPDGGSLRVAKPVSAILELGVGFHPEFTGRDNALLYGAVVGVPERVMKERVEDVLAFADLGEYVDQPVRTYSSGMVARLAFAVATHVEPTVLAVDEALAVGDGAFQKKCIDRMVRFKEEGRTVLFCSHAMYLVTSFCQRAVWLHEGRVRAAGDARGVVEEYETFLMQRSKRQLDRPDVPTVEPRLQPTGKRLGRVRSLRVLGLDGHQASTLSPGDGLEVEMEVESLERATEYHVGVALDSQDGRCLFGATTQWDGLAPLTGCARYLVRLKVPTLPVATGCYSVSCFLLDQNGLHVYDQVVIPAAIRFTSERWTPSLLHAAHEWIVPR